MRFFYNIFILLYPLVIRFVSLFNPKASLWIKGRKNIFNELKNVFENNNFPVCWIHCSSMGEFEQARPIIEQIKKDHLEVKILLTFFSPSGFVPAQNIPIANWIFYLPMDCSKNAVLFYKIVRPQFVIFIKYDFWYYYITKAKELKIPIYLVSAAFRSNQLFGKWYGGFYRDILKSFSIILVQDNNSVDLLNSWGIDVPIIKSGDTRFDRVLEIKLLNKDVFLYNLFKSYDATIVAGSTWYGDDEVLSGFLKDYPFRKAIIAPHDVSEHNIKKCLSIYPHAIRYSEINDNKLLPQVQTILIDSIGLLSRLYPFGRFCFVGGGFGIDGVHNVLEPAVYGKPVFCGTNIKKYQEAVKLKEIGVCFPISNSRELTEKLLQMEADLDYYNSVCTKSANFITENAGATQKVCNVIYENLRLTN